MRLYLVQHGDAVDKSADPDRPLSGKGEQDVRAVASALARAAAAPVEILHSGKSRARQTAEIFCEALGVSTGGREIAGIAPLDPVAEFAERLPERAGTAMVCGHQPFMGNLVSFLLAGSDERSLVEYVPGSVACLEGSPGGQWVLCWFLRPELCRAKD